MAELSLQKLQSQINTKANTSHTHLGSDITSKVANATYADSAGSVPWSGVTGAPTISGSGNWTFVKKGTIASATSSFVISGLDVVSFEYQVVIDALGTAYAAAGGYYSFAYPNTTTQTNTTDFGYISTSGRGAANRYVLALGLLYNTSYPPNGTNMQRKIFRLYVTPQNYVQMQMDASFDNYYGFCSSIYNSKSPINPASLTNITIYTTNEGMGNGTLVVGIPDDTVWRLYSKPRD